jgi:hypothetical protein
MKYLDRLIVAAVAIVLVAVALPPAVPAVINVVIVGTVCFVVIRLVHYYTNRW